MNFVVHELCEAFLTAQSLTNSQETLGAVAEVGRPLLPTRGSTTSAAAFCTKSAACVVSASALSAPAPQELPKSNEPDSQSAMRHVERHVGHDRALSASAPRSDAGGVEAGGFGFSSEAGVHPNAHSLEPSGPRHRVAA